MSQIWIWILLHSSISLGLFPVLQEPRSLESQCKEQLLSNWSAKNAEHDLLRLMNERVVFNRLTNDAESKSLDQGVTVFRGDSSAGICLRDYGNSAWSFVFNDSYGFRLTRKGNEDWRLIAMSDRNDALGEFVKYENLVVEARAGVVNFHELVHDNSFIVTSAKENAENANHIDCSFHSKFSYRPDLKVNNGKLVLNKSKNWRLERFEIGCTFPDVDAIVKGSFQYDEEGRCVFNEFANFIDGKWYAKVSRTIKYDSELVNELIHEDKFYLSDYGFPEPAQSIANGSQLRFWLSIFVLGIVAFFLFFLLKPKR